jgi:hypothetical protein
MSNYAPRSQEPNYVMWFFTLFIALYLSIVFGGITLGLVAREYVRYNIKAVVEGLNKGK